MPNTGKLGAIALVGLVAACGPSVEPRLEASPTLGIAVDAPSPTQGPTESLGDQDGAGHLRRGPEVRKSDPAPVRAGTTVERRALTGRPPGRLREPRSWGPVPDLRARGRRDERKLTHMKRGASDPTWSPDGTQIAFAGTRRRDGDRHPDADIFVMNVRREPHPAIGRDRETTATRTGLRTAHGSLFHSRYVSRGGEGFPGALIWVASVRTRTLTQLTPRHTRWAEADPAWSPDGRWIAFSRADRHWSHGCPGPGCGSCGPTGRTRAASGSRTGSRAPTTSSRTRAGPRTGARSWWRAAGMSASSTSTRSASGRS